jgi:uncharacterized membrane protein YdjX (TVP38/TMEM64 family)
MMTDTQTAATPTPSKPLLVRLWPLYIIVGGLALAISQGWHSYLSPTSLAENAAYLDALVKDKFVLVLLAYIVIYLLATAVMVPASALTIGGGFLFGVLIGAPATVIGATLGACVLFFATRSSIGGVLKEKAGPFLGKMEKGFNDDALSYMFSLRLVPAVPFAVANIAPGILGAKFRDYFLSTALGIIPGTVAYVWLGAALKGTLLEAAQTGEAIDAGALIKSSAANFFPALIALGVVSLIPIIYKKVFKKTPAA